MIGLNYGCMEKIKLTALSLVVLTGLGLWGQEPSKKAQHKGFDFNLEKKLRAVPSGQELESFYQEAKKRGFPTLFFDELKARNAWIVVKNTSGGAQYRRGMISGGTIYVPSAEKELEKWTSVDFSNFYNELFHAWWDKVFLVDKKYESERQKLFGDKNREEKYNRAFPGDPRRAQEEAYSETVATLMIYIAGRRYVDPKTQRVKEKPLDLNQLYYRTDFSVSPVSHSDVPGYTEASENIYPDEEEYDWLFEKMFNRRAPKKNSSLPEKR